MNKIMAIFLREYLERVRRRSFFIGLILVPLLMGTVIILPMWLAGVDEAASSSVYVIDESGRFKGDLEGAIQSELETGEQRFRFLDAGLEVERGRLGDPEYLEELIESEAIDWYLVIPTDPLGGEELEFHGRVVTNFTLLEMLEGKMTELMRRERLRSLELDPELLEQITVSASIRTLQHKGGETSDAGFESIYMSTMVMVMILYMTILVFGNMIQRSILEDKNQHITEVVLSSMSATRFFIGKILGIGAVGLTQYLAWFLVIVVLIIAGPLAQGGGGKLPSLELLSYVYFVLFYVFGFLLYAGLYAALGAMCTTDQEAQQMGTPLVMMLVVPMVSLIYILQNPDSPATVALSLIPMFSPLVMFMRINISDPPFWQVLVSFAILIATTGLVFNISGRIFRVGILMTGKKASLVEALRWVKQS
jgi:ABC-2 type transport system permease protein